jgi:hypothetical protein
MILPGDVPRTDDKVRTNVLLQIANGYDAVIAKEVAGDLSKPAQIEGPFTVCRQEQGRDPRGGLMLCDAVGSICTRNRVMTGLRSLFRVTLRRLDLAAAIYHIREPQKLPLAMSPDETRRLLAVASNLKVRTLLSLNRRPLCNSKACK